MAKILAASGHAPLLAIRSLVKHFGGIRAVDGASLDIPAGSITGLIGPNGAGKSTLFGMVAGFMRPDAGSVLLDGEDVTGLAPHRLFARGLVRTFQIPATFDRMTVRDNLMVVPAGQTGESLWRAWLQWRRVRTEDSAIRARADEVLAFLNIGQVADEYAGNLSGGQKKLLELGRTMMTEPRLVLLDEPGAGVNPTLMGKLREHIRRLNTERGYTICIVEHDMDLIASLCDQVIVMAEGKVLARGSMDEVRSNAAVREAYLGGAARGGGT